MTISTNIQSANIAIATMRAVRAEFPEVHLTSGPLQRLASGCRSGASSTAPT